MQDAISAWKSLHPLVLVQSIQLSSKTMLNLFGADYSSYWIDLYYKGCGSQALEEIAAISAWCGGVADIEEREASRCRAEGFRKWVKEAVAAGVELLMLMAKFQRGGKRH